MLAGLTSLAGLALLLQAAQAAPQPVPLESGVISILEDIHVHAPIIWHEVVNPDGSKSNFTDVDNALWDDAVARLGPDPTAVVKRQERACFGAGSWAKQVVLHDGVFSACLTLSSTPRGQTRVFLRDGFNSAGDPMTVHYTKQRNSNVEDGSGLECQDALHWLINNCRGGNADSRGGRVNWRTGDQYIVDRQTHNCNC
ncbi:hypothetical protein B0I35DRAFT_464509 [Stachybotrys elegans]|uniref:Ecp2 effector protein domain-containing protein n=1 Tax=Stachybotrys elegans TaxID=80388 RepID=A0A8K0SGI9_9HYPO|nr:hypothetical protein B0I35DRAFT_464509 [Stachybotrys elegans]